MVLLAAGFVLLLALAYTASYAVIYVHMYHELKKSAEEELLAVAESMRSRAAEVTRQSKDTTFAAHMIRSLGLIEEKPDPNLVHCEVCGDPVTVRIPRAYDRCNVCDPRRVN